MQVIRTQCDVCKKETVDHYDEPGWIQIGSSTANTQVCISRGRRPSPSNAADNGFRDFKVVDLCGEKCLLAWFKAVKVSK